MSKPSCTNSPTSSSVCGSMDALQLKVDWSKKSDRRKQAKKEAQATADRLERDYGCRYLFSGTYCGGYSGEDPPLPIPNREVKLTIADGTAPPGGRVGSCHFFMGV